VLEFQAVTQQPSESPKPRTLSDTQITGLMAQSGCLVFGVVLAAVIAGIWLDRVLNTRPLLTLLLVLGSVPVTLYMLFRIAMRAVSGNKQGIARTDKDRNDHDDEA
jgi:F0F1-type ATP synthase assembly protein I